MNEEQELIAQKSSWYSQKQLDIDKKLIYFCYQTLKPHLKGPKGLELGPADGQMTQYLLDHFEQLTIVDGAQDLLIKIPDASNLLKICSLFEAFEPSQKYQTIIAEHVLEHVQDPVYILKRAMKWLAPEGKILVGVPNGNSIHRLAAVKMKLLKNPCELNARDKELGHRRIYTPETFKKDIELSGLRILEIGGIFFKPLANQQIQDHWTEAMIQGFYELGKDFPNYAADIYAVCGLP